MKASELRIGNYVWEDYSGYMIVTAINSVTNENKEDFISLAKTEKLPSAAFQSKLIQPILLTEEVLLKCEGIEVAQRGINREVRLIVGDFEDWTLRLVLTNGVCQLEDFEGSLFFKVKYLHQLQNIYFIFCEKELKINL